MPAAQHDMRRHGEALHGAARAIPPGTVTSWTLTLSAGDIVVQGSGSIDRTTTARRIAALHCTDFGELSAGAQASVVASVQGQLPRVGQSARVK